ncbi:MAG: LysR family transcriptional regulator [Lachnospiraceae bacterium]|nr:LysR family transcriptional regulator [Lachnospiraceae bacterium]
MEIEHIKEFLVLSTVLNYERAADILYISQSSLFKHIKVLEADLGVELFEKNGKRINLTKFGEKLIPYAKKIEAMDENFRRSLTGNLPGEPEVIRMYAERPFIDLVMDFNLRHPGIQVDAFYGQEGMDGSKILATGAADVAILENVFGLDDTFEIIPFERRPLSVLVYDDHPLAKRKVVAVSELKEEKFVALALLPNGNERHERLFKKAQFEPHIVITATSDESLQRMVREKIGIALVFENSIDYHVNGLKLINLKTSMRRDSYLCYKKQNTGTDATDIFIEYVRKRARWDGTE